MNLFHIICSLLLLSQVASGEVDMAIGGDEGGSIRIPASWCGIVGLKPTYGLVPCTGAVTLDPSLTHLGPMTRTVDDCAALLEVSIQPFNVNLYDPFSFCLQEVL